MYELVQNPLTPTFCYFTSFYKRVSNYLRKPATQMRDKKDIYIYIYNAIKIII